MTKSVPRPIRCAARIRGLAIGLHGFRVTSIEFEGPAELEIDTTRNIGHRSDQFARFQRRSDIRFRDIVAALDVGGFVLVIGKRGEPVAGRDVGGCRMEGDRGKRSHTDGHNKYKRRK